MGANFEYTIIPDAKLEMSNVEIHKAACEIFEKDRELSRHDELIGLVDDPGLEQFTNCSIRRDLVFDDEDTANEYVDENLEDTKWSEYAHVVGVRNSGWFVGGWVHC